MGSKESDYRNLSADDKEIEQKALLEWLKSCKYIGFDVDGTLLDAPIGYYRRVTAEAFKRLVVKLQSNIPILNTVQRITINGLVRQLKETRSTHETVLRVTHALQFLQPDIDERALQAQLNAYWEVLYEVEHGNNKNLRTRMKEAGPYDVNSLLPLQQSDRVLFLISNVPTDILSGYRDAIRWHTGVTFPYVLTPWMFPGRAGQMKKPNVQLFEHAIADMQGLGYMDPNLSFREIMRQTAYVGDDMSDMLFAQGAGALPVWMNKEGEQPKGFSSLNPFLEFRSCEEITRAILE